MKTKFQQRLAKRMTELNVRQVDVVTKMKNISKKRKEYNGIEIPKGTIAKYVNGQMIPKKERLSLLAEALDVNEDWLYGYDVPKERQEPDHNANIVKLSGNSIKIPVLGKIPAGIPIEAIEDIRGYEDIPSDWIKNGEEFFALYICGDSMMPDYYFGDIIIIKKQEDCNSGDDCAVMVNGDEAIFKRVIKNKDGIILKSLNSNYDPLFFSKEKIETTPVRILGVAVEVRRKLKHR